MNTPDPLRPRVSMTTNAMGQPAENGVDPQAIIAGICSGQWRKPVEAVRKLYAETLSATGDYKAAKKAVDPLKKKLPGIMPAGTFKQRGNAHLEIYSGLLCADLDNLSQAAIDAAFAMAKNDPHVVAAFRSPTGTGLKIWFCVAGTAAQHDNATFSAVRKHVADTYGQAIDQSCKNLERLCFVSYDPQAFWKDGAKPLPPMLEPAKPTPVNGPSAAQPEMRRRIAVEMLGAIKWSGETKGFCICPGHHLHTSANAPEDCKLHLDGAPTVDCFHNSCRGIRDGVNHEMRCRIGKAEHAEVRRRGLEAKRDRTRTEKERHANSQGEAAAPLAAAVTPAQWFAEKFAAISPAEFGAAIREEADKEGVIVATDLGEDFLAATMGAKGSPDSPTVFIPTENKFYTYSPGDGVFLHKQAEAFLPRLSRLVLDCVHACRDGCDTKALEFRLRDSANLSGVIRKARGLLEVSHDFFASDLTEFIPCANGMLRLRDRTLLPFSPSYRRRNKLAAPYDPAAKCPLFLDTLIQTALEDDDLELLQRWCGLALIGENLAQRILILTGTAGGGKGTFVRVLTGIIGQKNLASLRPQHLGERFELGRFLGKTLLYGADVPDNFLNHRGASVLKSLTGHDPVTLEFKGSNESPSITCRFNVLATCNSRLTVHLEGDVAAWRRRLVIIEYRKPKPEKVVANLDELILQQEAAGVLNWMLEGLDKLRADGWQLHLNARQQTVVNNLLLESDSLAVFARDGLRRATGGLLTVSDGFAAYVEFCTEHGWAALPKNKFTSGIADVVVRQFGLTVRHDIPDGGGKPQRGWKALTLVTNFTGTSGENPSEVSETQPATPSPDSSDNFSPVRPGKISASKPAEALLL